MGEEEDHALLSVGIQFRKVAFVADIDKILYRFVGEMPAFLRHRPDKRFVLRCLILRDELEKGIVHQAVVICIDNGFLAIRLAEYKSIICALPLPATTVNIAEIDMTRKNDILQLTFVYKQLGRCYRNNSQFADALRTHREGLNCAIERKDTVEIVRAYNHLGTDYRRMGMNEDAAQNHYQALELCEKYVDKTSFAARKNRVTSLNGLGNMFLSLKELHLADSLFRLALKEEKSLGSHNGQAINYSNLGSIFEAQNQLDSARVYYQYSMAHNREINSELGISLCHINFGRLYEKQKQWVQAQKEYRQAYDIMKDHSDRC